VRDHAASIARTVSCGLAALALLLVPLQMASGQVPQDRGIGGTGVVPSDQDSDRGIGGTGMLGTIRGFGSIIVNGAHVTYAPDVPVRIDGQPRTASDLKVGQVVRVIAENRSGVLATGQIDVVSEAVGTIDAIHGTTLTVLGQTVSTEGLGAPSQWRRGERVAVFGLRRPDGAIVASLIERRDWGLDRIAGRLLKSSDGGFRIGSLRITGADPSLAGARVVLEGSYANGTFKIAGAARERDLLGMNVRRLSIEAYVERTRSGLRLGSGLEVAGGTAPALPAGSYAPAVVTVVSDQRGRLSIENVSLEGSPTQSNQSRRGQDTDNSRKAPADAGERKATPGHLNSGSGQSSRNGASSGSAHGHGGNGGSPGKGGGSNGGSGAGGNGSGGRGNAGGNGNGGNAGHGGGNGRR